MKSITLLFACIAFLSFTVKTGENKNSLPPIPIAGVYLYSNNITTNAGSVADGHPDEVRLAYDSNDVTLPVTIGAGGPQPGTPAFSAVTIRKAFDITSLRLSRLVLNPLSRNFEIRYYNGVATEPVYKIVLQNSFVSAAGRATVDCQGNGCIGLKETYAITFGTIEYHNLMLSPPQILTYNRATQTYTWTNN